MSNQEVLEGNFVQSKRGFRNRDILLLKAYWKETYLFIPFTLVMSDPVVL